MKKFFLVFLLSLILNAFSYSQKFAFVDTDYILNNVPTYESAKEQLEQVSKKWQKEIEDKYKEIETMYKKYQTEKHLFSEEMRIQRENEIVNSEKEVKKLQKKYFGKDGDLFKKRQDLIKPIQDEIYKYIEEIASEGDFAIIFDTATSAGSILYTNPKHDKSDEILQKMGYR